MSDTAREALRQQKIQNLNLKCFALENEELIQDFVLEPDFSSDTQKQKLHAALEKGTELLRAVETGTKWMRETAYNVQKLMRVCGLEMSPQELFKPDDKPQIDAVVGVKKTLDALQQRRNLPIFAQMLGNLEKIETELRRSQLDASGILSGIPVGMLESLARAIEADEAACRLALRESGGGDDNKAGALLAAADEAKQSRDIALANGDSDSAHNHLHAEAQLLETLLKEQAKFFDSGEGDADAGDVQQAAFERAAAMKDAKRRLKQRVEDDIKHLHDAIQKADLEDAEAMKRFMGQKDKSDEFLCENAEKLEQTWLAADAQRLQKLGRERFDEVKRRIDENDREEQRKVEYQQFLDVCGQHKKLLELTVYNCDVAIRCVSIIEELVALGAAAIKNDLSASDTARVQLAALSLTARKQYHDAFRRLSAVLAQLQGLAKQKHNSEAARAIQRRIDAAREAWLPTKNALVKAGVAFIDPADE